MVTTHEDRLADDARDVRPPGRIAARFEGDGDATTAVTRLGWGVACLLAVTKGVQAWSSSNLVPGASAAQMVIVAVGLVAFAHCWIARTGPSTRVQLAVMACVAGAVVITTAEQVVTAPAYGTDSVAFGQYAAELVAAGHNPYTMSMLPALNEFHVPVVYQTHFFDGRPMLTMSYPAGSFLVYLPFVLAGWTTQTAVVVDVAFWIGSAVLLWRLLPAQQRFAAPIVLGLSAYSDYIIGGVTDSLYLPFLIVAMWRWDRYADPAEPGAARWIGPVAMGIAMAIKQTPWFIVPFLVIGVAIEARRRQGRWLSTALRYAGTTAMVFLLINLPWLIASPLDWWRDSAAPLIDKFIPMGQGLVNLTLVYLIGGGRLDAYNVAGACWLLGILLALILRYSLVKRVWLPLAICAFFFISRSMGNYLMMMLPAALVATVSVNTATADTPTGRHRWLERLKPTVLVSAVVAVAASAVVALATPPPLTVTVDDARSNGQQSAITDVTVTVTNTTDQTQQPHFTVDHGGYTTNFWYPVGLATPGTVLSLPPHARRTVVVHAPDIDSMPSISEPFHVYAYTSDPEAVSTSRPFTLSPNSLLLLPRAIDEPVPLGQRVSLTVQVTDRLGSDVHRAGLRIALGQVVYAENGILGGESSIDGLPEGASPAYTVTDPDGRAHFTVSGGQNPTHPTYYQAWIDQVGRAPVGYSNLVTVQYSGAQ